jgi:hypothetical protein
MYRLEKARVESKVGKVDLASLFHSSSRRGGSSIVGGRRLWLVPLVQFALHYFGGCVGKNLRLSHNYLYVEIFPLVQ